MAHTAEETRFLNAISNGDVKTVQKMMDADNKLIFKYRIAPEVVLKSGSTEMMETLLLANPALLNNTTRWGSEPDAPQLNMAMMAAGAGTYVQHAQQLPVILEVYERLGQQGKLDANMRVVTLPVNPPIAFDITALKDNKENTALHYAASRNGSNLIKPALNAYTDVGLDSFLQTGSKKELAQVRNSKGDTPLHSAMRNSSDLGVVRLVLAADPEQAVIRNNNGDLPVDLSDPQSPRDLNDKPYKNPDLKTSWGIVQKARMVLEAQRPAPYEALEMGAPPVRLSRDNVMSNILALESERFDTLTMQRPGGQTLGNKDAYLKSVRKALEGLDDATLQKALEEARKEVSGVRYALAKMQEDKDIYLKTDPGFKGLMDDTTFQHAVQQALTIRATGTTLPQFGSFTPPSTTPAVTTPAVPMSVVPTGAGAPTDGRGPVGDLRAPSGLRGK